MEVVAATPSTGNVPPFHDHDVREWSRIDSLTGVLERARLETDHWSANTSNSTHKYGKVVDSRARTNADGALQQQARRQLEVFQSHIPGGHLQVIKTQTVSSSRWTNKEIVPVKDFENLQLSLNPLDLTSQKSKANVGRSVGRRPPSRPRAKDESLSAQAQQNLYRVSRLCHQIHEDAVKQTINNEKHHLIRTKSTSSEDLEKSSKSIEDLEDLEQLQSWRRTSKLRRSLQYPKENNKPSENKPITTSDLPEVGSVRKIREELEKGRRLSTALRNNSVDLQALDQILQTISNSSSSTTSSSSNSTQSEEIDTSKKRNSFVTVESLQEVRGRLRRTSTDNNKEEETDDGIDMPEKSRVRSYVYGMEAMIKKPILGTGSLESRSKFNGSTSLRNEDWYNRRKSYGFEQVHNHTETSSPISLKNKGRVESSTDSGICRSSEIVVLPTPTNCDKTFTSVKQISSIFDQKKDLTTITIPIISSNNYPEKEIKRHSIAVDESKYDKFRRTHHPTTIDDNFNRRLKKVEFCKTEVHFAAESGKVNIVETDEKPPPTNNFRRRRRNSQDLLPVLHFGDSWGEEDYDVGNSNNFPVSYSTVTVNATPIEYTDEERKTEAENVKGILKNKPIKPIPYHLGGEFLSNNNGSSDNKFGVRLKPVAQTEQPSSIWKSTVTLHNTIYQNDEEDQQPEFQKLLKNLRPITNKPDLVTNESFSSVKYVTNSDNRRPIKSEDWGPENKVYSTKVNFGGDGGAAVVELENPKDKAERILNKGLVVRIGRNDTTSKHTVCSKTTSLDSNSTTTTKITIDLSPSPPTTNNNIPPPLVPPHCFKSTSLVLDTLKNDQKTTTQNIPQQLEALKKLYEDVHSDSSDADKEVQVLMGGRLEKNYDNTSEISGSWSKMRACRIFNEKTSAKLKIEKDENFSRIKTRTNLKLVTNDELSSPSLVNDTEFANITDTKVLRQPKKSEMTYFGVRVSPQTTAVIKSSKLSQKPDLLQHNEPTTTKLRKKSPPITTTEPIYENLKKFDSNILDELTKAADEIMLAVNGFTDDDNKHSEEEEKKFVPLDTISESKSWSRKEKTKSSNSSIETRRKTQDRVKKKTNEISTTATNSRAATTKARRLQRASSREKLLQSHGSSSEDLGVNIEPTPPVRKPRQIKKTKSAQLSVSNGLEMAKKSTRSHPIRRRDISRNKLDDRVEVVPEIRHKTAISTIKSTAEKSERTRTRIEDSKKPIAQKNTKGVTRNEPRKPISSREVSNHRISTANIKKCQRAEEGTRHS